MLIALNGRCGAEDAPGALPLLVGDPVHRCPVALALQHPEAGRLAQVLPSAYGPGLFGTVPPHTLPPQLRSALALAEAWLAAWKQQQQPQQHEEG